MPPLLQPLRKLTHLYIMVHANVYHFLSLASDSVAPFDPEGAMDFEGTGISLASRFPSLLMNLHYQTQIPPTLSLSLHPPVQPLYSVTASPSPPILIHYSHASV